MGVAAAQQRSISAPDCLNCLTACAPAGLQHLRHLELDSLHLLRLLSTTHAADQSWTTAVPAAGAAPSGSDGGGVRRLLGTDSSNDGVGGSAAVGLPGSSSLPPQQQLQGSQEQGLPVAQSPQEAAAAADAAAAAEAPAAAEKEEQQQGDELLLWGELFARAPRRGLAVLLPPRRRQDVAEQLIARVSMLQQPWFMLSGVKPQVMGFPGQVKGLCRRQSACSRYTGSVQHLCPPLSAPPCPPRTHSCPALPCRAMQP